MIHGVYVDTKKGASNTKNKASNSVNTPEFEQINPKSSATEKKNNATKLISLNSLTRYSFLCCFVWWEVLERQVIWQK